MLSRTEGPTLVQFGEKNRSKASINYGAGQEIVLDVPGGNSATWEIDVYETTAAPAEPAPQEPVVQPPAEPQIPAQGNVEVGTSAQAKRPSPPVRTEQLPSSLPKAGELDDLYSQAPLGILLGITLMVIGLILRFGPGRLLDRPIRVK